MRPLIAALLMVLLAAASTAHETAWVLWLKVETQMLLREDSRSWVEWNLAGMPTYADCSASLRSTVKTQLHNKPTDEKVTAIGDNTLQRVSTISSVMYTWSCLPAGTDPRGPAR
jgi:hypothetical protein